MTHRILITGATGTIGSLVAEGLLEQDITLRLATREPARLAHLQARGAEVVALDWDAPETYAAAFEGVDRVFLLTPFVERAAPYVERAVAAAKAAGVSHIVRMSALGASPDGDGVSRDHGEGEVLVQQSGLGWTVLQPTFFADNPLVYQRPSLDADGAFYGASSGGRVSYIAVQDIADVAVKALLEPAAHAGQTHVLTGREALGDDELASVLSSVLGKAVRYVDVPAEPYGASLLDAGTPAWMTEHLLALEHIKAQGYASAVSPAVEQILGRPPRTVAEGLARHAGLRSE